MKALLLHDLVPDGLAHAVLSDAGYDVVRCSGSHLRPFPCVGMDGNCPLDGSVDVAVVVHDRPTADFHPGEVGVVCALRDGIPVVTAGNGAFAPFRNEATVVAAGVSDLPAACERAIAARAARLGRAVGATVEVRGDQVRATLPTDATPQDAIAVHQALVTAVPGARTIDVGFAGANDEEA